MNEAELRAFAAHYAISVVVLRGPGGRVEIGVAGAEKMPEFVLKKRGVETLRANMDVVAMGDTAARTCRSRGQNDRKAKDQYEVPPPP